MKKLFRIYAILSVLTGVLFIYCTGQLRLPKFISDGMVLQRDANVNIWGWTAPGEKVQVLFMDSVFNTSANNAGE